MAAHRQRLKMVDVYLFFIVDTLIPINQKVKRYAQKMEQRGI
jgi:hypothetical protein